jgi:histidinol-phosphate aminotransferase
VTLRSRPWLHKIEPYQPGQPAEGGDGSLASNESLLGVSDNVVRAISAAMNCVHRYPDPLADKLRTALASHHSVDPEQILVGNGSDELIYLLALAYLAQAGHAVCADPAYRINEISAYLVDARLTKVPLRGWAHDLDQMARIAADIAYVVNPHNPAGTLHSRAAIERFAATAAAGLVIVDEAYIDFTDDPAATTAVPLVASGRVAVLRTFSKIHSMAGLRVGYLIADSGIVATLRKIRPPFSVGSLAQAGALAALEDHEHRRQLRMHTRRNRQAMTWLFERAGYTVVPSQANFVLIMAPDEEQLEIRLREHGVVVRRGSTLGVPGAVRVSVPSDAGLGMLARALSSPGDRERAAAETSIE